jgi:YlmC/YmxH family sporulation protein
MYLSDLQNKDIISTKDGRKLGSIIDVEINEQGNIVNLIIEEKKSFKRIISSSDIKISFKDIAKIG